ncbi:prepilin-type N-terminal cleavage/methylation domain-containing protein [Neorhodopirellula lusitana]|uniref:Prepilin-type N-terminal cleavage/methylation domain-containing protein n=1 Tax=Neorhodopirellula lusitana TaxID=445327 RepID=A0ABY1QBF3_9BACT|nr:type II secretion system protein [Neorhodopirellula lusitana]SMP63338.1 prepilin-type N-terminal cleavage/methylation domain-containing protein [Neorhodopirellula lusitana]
MLTFAAPNRTRSARETRHGFSLLEMILAVGLLGASLGILAQVAMTGTDAAMEAEQLAQARMIAQSQLAQILVSDQSPQTVPLSPIDPMDSASTTPFEYQVDVVPASIDGMLAIRVSVQANRANGGTPTATYSITRWMIDPLLGLADAAAEEAALREEELGLTDAL